MFNIIAIFIIHLINSTIQISIIPCLILVSCVRKAEKCPVRKVGDSIKGQSQESIIRSTATAKLIRSQNENQDVEKSVRASKKTTKSNRSGKNGQKMAKLSPKSNDIDDKIENKERETQPLTQPKTLQKTADSSKLSKKGMSAKSAIGSEQPPGN